MKFTFWLVRFLLVLVGAFVVIAGAQYLKSHSTLFALTQGAIWAPITAAVYISVLVYKFRKNPVCFIPEEDQK